jgi:hypothetical protein
VEGSNSDGGAMRFTSVVVLCGISAAVGAGIDHYWEQLSPLAGSYWSKMRSLAGSNALQTDQTTASRSGAGKVEVLGDRVRCDNRYIELKIPESEYRTFFDRCMGTASTNK